MAVISMMDEHSSIESAYDITFKKKNAEGKPEFEKTLGKRRCICQLQVLMWNP